ncbi:unnamed protein product [Ceutorhynchus assimilis]|uniref:Uncharacterized protein n=1 Tax=Ceutorhynchus assimilis TaxID=467358 RepID=A0A9N9MMQ7_9CUCU|nr:unnamed protein product [Ceutorhynchus assimilis]
MHDDFNVHRKVREITRKGHKNNCKPLVNEAGEIIIDAGKKKEAWKTYLENLFHDLRKEQKPTVGEGPEILVDEDLYQIGTRNTEFTRHLTSRVNQLATEVDDLKQDVSGLTEAVHDLQNLDAHVEELNTAVNPINSNVAELDKTLSTH